MHFMSTNEIGKRLGFPLPAKFIIKTLGVAAEKREKAAYLWTPDQFKQMCDKIEARAQAARIEAHKPLASSIVGADDDEL